MITGKEKMSHLNVHVFPMLGQWAIFDEKEERPKCLFPDPKDALKSAKKILKRNPLQTKVIIHDKNGKIQVVLNGAG